MTNPPDNNPGIAQLLQRLASQDSPEAWGQFLTDYAPLIYDVIQSFEQDQDLAGDCFLFVCEKLCQNQFRRMRRFNPRGPARFSTWLRVVVRNLCLDWHRKEFGRQQIFQTIARLAPLDQEIFKAVYHQNLSAQDCCFRLAGRHAGLTMTGVEDSLSRIRQALTPRQLWLLQSRRPRVEAIESEQEESGKQIADPARDPEALAVAKEQESALESALMKLEVEERLLLKLRFEQELTLSEVARLVNLKDAQTVDRRIGDILNKLRKQLAAW